MESQRTGRYKEGYTNRYGREGNCVLFSEHRIARTLLLMGYLGFGDSLGKVCYYQ